ncbi:MAG: helix-turn-helix transcriptional regulator [Pontibacterium sp.]
MTERLLSMPQVEEITGFKKSYIFRERAAGRFPEPLRIGSSVRWKASDVSAWIEAFSKSTAA